MVKSVADGGAVGAASAMVVEGVIGRAGRIIASFAHAVDAWKAAALAKITATVEHKFDRLIGRGFVTL